MSYKINELQRQYWPPLLEEIPDGPEKLFYAGKVPDWRSKLLCVVGSRKFTNYGKETTESLIEGLRGYPVTIVSGLALGIDSIAHRAAIKNGLPTIAIPGSGLSPSALHPQTHIKLAQDITETGGTLISEMEPDQKASLLMHDTTTKKVFFSFPKRNRLMAGMSNATLIIEADKKSGTLITARLATDYNREVLAVPGSIFNTTSYGPHMLIRLGATPIRNSEDILEALHLQKIEDSDSSDNERKYFDCSESEMKIIIILAEPLERDEIIRQAQDKFKISIAETQTLLSLLELKGLIKETLGQIRLV